MSIKIIRNPNLEPKSWFDLDLNQPRGPKIEFLGVLRGNPFGLSGGGDRILVRQCGIRDGNRF